MSCLDLWAIVPELILAGLALLLVPVAGLARGRWRGVPAGVAALGLVAALGFTVRMLAWSPYDNLPPAGGRPDLLVTGAVHDPRVMVREPAKWVAALRASDPEWSPRCLFRCEVGAGAHAGPSGRFGHLAYEAEVAAWLLDRLGVTTTDPTTDAGERKQG